jgi:hypothetical protein
VRIQGTIDRCEPGLLSGWVIDHDQPGQRIAMQVVCAGAVLGDCVSDRFRPDLATAGLGDGHHSFEYELPLNMPRVALRAVRLRLSDSHAYLLQNISHPEDSAVEPVFTNLSRFGGLWLDRLEWLDRMGAMTRGGIMDEAMSSQLMRFARDGYLHLPAALPPAVVDAISAQIDALWAAPPAGLAAARRLEYLSEQPTVPDTAARAAGDALVAIRKAEPPISLAAHQMGKLGGDSRPIQVDFVGLRASNARRIVYVVDASGSLVGSFPQIVEELRRSMMKLDPRQQFGVIFFQRGDAVTVPPGGALQPATPERLSEAVQWNKTKIIPEGRTKPMPPM